MERKGLLWGYFRDESKESRDECERFGPLREHRDTPNCTGEENPLNLGFKKKVTVTGKTQ